MRNPTRTEKIALIPLIAVGMILWPRSFDPFGFVERVWAQMEQVSARLTVVNNVGEIVTTGVYATNLPVNTSLRIDPLRFRDMAVQRGDSAYLVRFRAKNSCGFDAFVDVRTPELRGVIMHRSDSTERHVELQQWIPLKFDVSYIIGLEDEDHNTLALKVSGPRQASCFGENHSH